MPPLYRLVLAGPQGHRRAAIWSPQTARLCWDDGTPLDLSGVGLGYATAPRAWQPAFPVHPTLPAGKQRQVRVLKIQLGLKCNYSCQYCNQAHQPHDGQVIRPMSSAFSPHSPTGWRANRNGSNSGVVNLSSTGKH